MSGARVDAASSLQRGVRFLLEARQASECGSARFWKDFSVFGRTSDEWVTAYVAVALAETGISEACDAAEAAWRFLIADQRKAPAGLGYNREAPSDADSTQWGCRLSVLLDRASDEWFQRAIEFLAKRCLRPDGGIATYPSAACLPMEIRDNTRGATEGWTSSHLCVTAAAAWLKELLACGDLTEFLKRTQSSEGFWGSYWWVDREYATALALESLSRHGLKRELIDRAAAWLEKRPPGTSSFKLSLRIIGISAAHRHDDALLSRLLALQLADGSWASSACMRIPPLNLRDPDFRWNWDEASDGFGGIVVDRARIFTTATAVRALTSCLAR